MGPGNNGFGDQKSVVPDSYRPNGAGKSGGDFELNPRFPSTNLIVSHDPTGR